jgi:isoquinoline 1-oxidoreductase beta subunit
VEQSNFYDYSLPRMNEVPGMHIELIKTDNAPTGAAGRAVHLQRVAELTGARLRHTPFLPDRVKKALA